MRRAVSSLIAAAALAGGFAIAAPAPVKAQECEGMGCAHANYERTRHSPAYGSRYDGYWDRRGEHRRHYRRGYDYRDYGSGYHYYPGYGYYPGRDHRDGYRYDHDGYGRDGYGRDGDRRDRDGDRRYDDRRDGREDCAAGRYRSHGHRSRCD